jgi:hypothetical protein
VRNRSFFLVLVRCKTWLSSSLIKYLTSPSSYFQVEVFHTETKGWGSSLARDR